MRSTFSEWANEKGYAEKDIELQLGHISGQGHTEMARLYGRNAKRLEPRRQLAEDWGEFCMHGPLPADVIPLRQANAKGDSPHARD